MRNTLLYDFYGDLLTKKQKEIYHMYFCEDLSLSEIGSKFGISRQAVNFSLKQSQKSFNALEAALGLIERYMLAREYMTKLHKAIEQGNRTESSRLLTELSEML